MRALKLLFGFIYFAFIPNACNTHTSPDTTKNKLSNFKYLDSTSPYQIKIPENYKIKINKGEGFVEYYFYPIDSAHNFGGAMFSFGGIDHRFIAPDQHKVLLADTSRSGILLNSKITWTIHKYDKSLSAQTSLNLSKTNELYASANADTNSNLDSMLKMLQSLIHQQ